MRVAFLIIALLHGLIHLLGFIKAFEVKEVKELTLPISKSSGIIWLLASILILTYALLNFLNVKYVWVIGVVAVLISQTLIIMFWKDARFGTIPNIAILLASIMSLGNYSFQKMIKQETTQLLNKNISIETEVLSETDLVNLPNPVKNWLRYCGAVGKPVISHGKVTQIAHMKIKPEQDKWLTATATQYTTIKNPAFIWVVDVKMNNFLNFQGRDKYVEGKGEMLIKLNSFVNVVHERGEKLDEGTLQRYLGEMVWFPSMALSPYITWEPINENAAKATMNYKGTTGSGTFYFNSNGEVSRFSALRYKGNEIDAKRLFWEVNIQDYKTFEGLKVPSKMTSTWKLDNKDWTWLKLEVTNLKYNNEASY